MKQKIITLFCFVVIQSLQAGDFPQDAWGYSYAKDFELAAEYMESQAPEISVEPPPADDSEVTKLEIQYLKNLSANRSAEDIVLIHKEHLDPYKRFSEVLGYDRQSHPATERLIQVVVRESYLPVLHFKHKFSRIRPYQIDPDLRTVIDGPPHASYPSGHATQGYLVASMLAELFPKGDRRRDDLIELGKGIGTRREIAGVHYPSDTKAGVNLAIQLKKWILPKPHIRQALLAAKAEINSTKR